MQLWQNKGASPPPYCNKALCPLQIIHPGRGCAEICQLVSSLHTLWNSGLFPHCKQCWSQTESDQYCVVFCSMRRCRCWSANSAPGPSGACPGCPCLLGILNVAGFTLSSTLHKGFPLMMRTTILFDSCVTILSQINYTLKRITLPISYEL